MTNFYCHFIETFSHVAISLTDMLKSNKNDKFKEMKFKITSEAIELFKKLKHCV